MPYLSFFQQNQVVPEFVCLQIFILLKKKNLFNFNLIFIGRFIRILIASIAMGIFFNFLINFFNDKLIYDEIFKSVYLIGVAISGLTFYIFVSIFIKAFKISDIYLKY